jgi:hypothetical protein
MHIRVDYQVPVVVEGTSKVKTRMNTRFSDGEKTSECGLVDGFRMYNGREVSDLYGRDFLGNNWLLQGGRRVLYNRWSILKKKR